ncbi:MAG TPA: sigma-70 family RNA polymerase sigma factor [Armatimonadota bacterium]
MAITSIKAALPWVRAAEDSRARFDALLSPLLVPLYRFALGMTHHRDDAEDLTQDAVVQAYRAFGSFRNGTNFKAWLFRICVNLYVDSYRSRRRIPAMMPLLDSDVDEDPEHARIASPEEEMMEAVMDEELERALSALPETFRAVVLLCDMEGMAYEETAAALSIPIGTVRSRLFRARNQLRAALSEFGRERGL